MGIVSATGLSVVANDRAERAEAFAASAFTAINSLSKKLREERQERLRDLERHNHELEALSHQLAEAIALLEARRV